MNDCYYHGDQAPLADCPYCDSPQVSTQTEYQRAAFKWLNDNHSYLGDPALNAIVHESVYCYAHTDHPPDMETLLENLVTNYKRNRK